MAANLKGVLGVSQDPLAPPSGPGAPSLDSLNALKTRLGPPVFDFGQLRRDLWLRVGRYHPSGSASDPQLASFAFPDAGRPFRLARSRAASRRRAERIAYLYV
jgi:hypothetical protein